MKKIKVSTNLPAFLSDFSTDSKNENFSRAKLKIFYKGLTGDKRLFTDSFSKKLIKTLPYQPVVSFYDEEKEDFIGHSKEQAIFGMVDPLSKIEFVKEDDGNTWAICEVVLMTQRPDSVGKIAEKIVGKAQSLELDPKTLKYVVNYTADKKLKNIEFTDGQFIGLSVLGDEQAPAFTGSEFFSLADFDSKMLKLKEYCLSNRGEEDMDVTIQNFVELAWGEKCGMINKALSSKYDEYCYYIKDIYDSFVVYAVYEEGENLLYKATYFINEAEEAELGEPVEVRVVYEEKSKEKTQLEDSTVYENTQVDTSTNNDSLENSELNEAAKKEEEDPKEEKDPKEKNSKEEDSKDKEDPKENAEKDKKGDCTIIEKSNITTSTSAFIESERAELETLRKEKKDRLIAEYQNDLPEEILKKYSDNLASYTVETLENELAKEYRKVPKVQNQSQIRVFQTFTPNERESNTLEELVKKYK